MVYFFKENLPMDFSCLCKSDFIMPHIMHMVLVETYMKINGERETYVG